MYQLKEKGMTLMYKNGVRVVSNKAFYTGYLCCYFVTVMTDCLKSVVIFIMDHQTSFYSGSGV